MSACVEGPSVRDGGVCTPQCAIGYKASETALKCEDGKLTPSAFACEACDPNLKGWAWYRFLPIKVRSPLSAGGVQLGELVFRYHGKGVSFRDAMAYVSHGNSTKGREPQRAIDGNTQTQWSETSLRPLVVRFQCPTPFDQYSFFTAGDAPERDPVQWRLEGSNDRGLSWANLHRVSLDHPTPYERYKLLDRWFGVPQCYWTNAPNNEQVCRSTEELVRRGLAFPETPR